MKKLSVLFCSLVFLLMSQQACKNTESDPKGVSQESHLEKLLSFLPGAWRLDDIGSGNITISTYFVFRNTNNQLEGEVIINNAVKIPMENMEIVTDTIAFTIFWGARYQIVQMEDGLRVLTSWGNAKPSISLAEKVSMDETAPPESIPLPEIEKVPANGLAMTPPMGWNSWNYFHTDIDDKTVRKMADAMVNSGMADAGYEFIVIDDGWEGGRDEEGNIYSNEKFPDMKALADYVHGKGLKLGIYSSPGARTCAGYEGSYGHEEQDARTFAQWGIDYLKYDWCGAMRIYPDSMMQACYQKMGMALLNCGRPIVYSLCQYGVGDVWRWGAEVGGNLWRTTGDIAANWEKVSEIGFNQDKLSEFAQPGHWNDPDMLEVGNGDLTFDENKAHFTLWCMLAAPLMAGNDLANMKQETLDILTNKNLIAINQDALGKQAKRFATKDSVEVWLKPLSDGSSAVALFNRNNQEVNASYTYVELGWESKPAQVTDVWREKEIKLKDDGVSLEIPRHGVVLLKGK